MKVGPLIAVGNRQGGKGMNTLKDGSYRWVLWCAVVLGVSSVALMPQHGEPVLTDPEFVDSLWVKASTRQGLVRGK